MANDKEFIERTEAQKLFWDNYKKIHSQNIFRGTVIFYGEGGIGKTRLLKELAKKFNPLVQNIHKDVACVHYDFENLFDTRTILLLMKNQLVKQGFQFPLFETGNFLYNVKIDNAEMTNAPKIQSFLDKTGWLRDIFSAADLLFPGANAAAIVVTKIADKIFEKINQDKIPVDDMKERIDAALNADNPNALYQLFPELFATDIKNYFSNADCEKKALVIFLDTYEKFVNDAVGTYEERARDLWLRGNGKSLMAIIPNALWVIAGRTNLNWSEDHFQLPVQTEKISAFDEDDSKKFLEKSGVKNEHLRESIAKLTQGSPIFLTICADIYEQYKKNHNDAEPNISEFGGEREKVAQRILKYIDPPTKDMLKFLCILNTWTDDIANEIGNEVLAFSEESYNQIKKFSFVQSEENEIIGEKIYSFDKTVQSILFPQCSKRTITRTKNFANQYFDEVLYNDDLTDNDEFIFYLKYWAKLLSAYTNTNDEEFIEQYDNNIKIYCEYLINSSRFDEAQNILDTYFEKLNDRDTRAYALFELETGKLELSLGLSAEALKHFESAYEKFSRLTDDAEEDEKICDVMWMLAIGYNFLENCEKALEFQEKILQFQKDHYGNEHKNTVLTMQNIAATLTKLERYDEALKILQKVLKIFQDKLGNNNDETIAVMTNLAKTFYHFKRYDEALNLQKKVVRYFKKNYDKTYNYIKIIESMASTLDAMERYDESLEIYKEAYELKEKLFEDNPVKIIQAKISLGNDLQYMRRYEEALEIKKSALELAEKNLNENDKWIAIALYNLASVQNALGKSEAAETIEQANNLKNKYRFNDEELVQRIEDLYNEITGSLKVPLN